VVLSLAEEEYMVASQAICEMIWMRKILVGLFSQMMDLSVIYCDNQSWINLSEKLVFHHQSKHTDIGYHHLWDSVQRQIMLLQYILIEEQDSKILSKTLSRGKYKFKRCTIVVVDNPFLVEREY